MADTEEQMAFDFFPDLPKQKKESGDPDLFESEEAALDALIETKASGKDDGETPIADPAPLCCSVPEPPEPERKAPEYPALTERTLRRLALAFLAGKNPAGLASNVYSGAAHLPLAAAAFAVSRGRSGEPEICSTTLILAAESPEKCQIPTAYKARRENALRAELAKKEELEAHIRETEPELNNSLFAEPAEWEYSKSRSRKYQFCLRRIEKLRRDLQYAGKLERILAEGIADINYLLCPETVEIPQGIPESWGILTAHKDLTVSEIKPAIPAETSASRRLELALAVAAAGRDGILFANGIHAEAGKGVSLTRIPRKRRNSF